MRSRWPVVAYTAIAAATGLLLLAAFSPGRGSQPSPASSSAQQQGSRLDVSHLPSFGARSISAAPADGCKPRQLFSAAEQRARREYQQFLLEDAKRFEAPMLTWAGYSGPWIENTFLEYWKQQYAAGVDMGDRIYLPVQWIDCYFKCEKPRKVQMLQYLATLKPEYTYFSVYMMDKGMVIAGMVMPPWLDLMLFSACATTKGVRTVPIPLLKVVLEPQGLPKDTQVNFLGDLTSHRLREEMAEILKPQGYLIGKARHEEIFGIIERSNFTLTPRGHGSASWRMYEALQLGSVPIFLWAYDPLIPFQELLNWNEMAIVVQRQEIKFIPHLIQQFNITRAQERLAQYRHMWTYEYVHQYIVDRLRREPCFPVPFSVWQDRWGWEQG